MPLKQLQRMARPLLRIYALSRQAEIPLLAAQAAVRASFPVAPWYETNYCEPAVQVALRDLCRPGDTVFDVGANAGSLTVLMSRLVGPRGAVCAFEASRRIVDKCQHNLIVNGCGNTQLYHRAVCGTSRQQVQVYHGSHLNDSIVAANDKGIGASPVETLALDDFLAYTGLAPKVIKMDIEGAEYDALLGARRLLTSTRCHLILEQQASDLRCHQLLTSLGYLAIDLAAYRRIESGADFAPGVEIVNLLYVHQSRLAETPYQPPFQFEPAGAIPGDAFHQTAEGSLEQGEPLTVAAGRYLFEFDHVATGPAGQVMLGLECDGVALARYHGESGLLAAHYRSLVVHLPRPAAVRCFYRPLERERRPKVDLRRVTLTRVTNFDTVAPPPVA
jgi:FkbM family methyltransferase